MLHLRILSLNFNFKSVPSYTSAIVVINLIAFNLCFTGGLLAATSTFLLARLEKRVLRILVLLQVGGRGSKGLAR